MDRSATTWFKRVACLLGGIVWLLPISITLYGGFNSIILAGRVQKGSKACLGNFTELWSIDLGNALLGSVIVGLSSAALAVILALCLSAYYLENRSKCSLLLAGAIGGRCIPAISLLSIHLVMVSCLKIPDSRWLLVLFHTFQCLPIALLILLPKAYRLHAGAQGPCLGDMVKLDGVGLDSYLLRILVPIMYRDIILATLFCFSLSWGEYIYAGLLCNDDQSRTLPVLMGTFETSQKLHWGLLYAAITVSFLGALLVTVGIAWAMTRRRTDQRYRRE